MEDIKRQRTSIKARLTRVCNQLEILCDTPNVSVIELKDTVLLCEERLTTYDAIQASLEQLLPPEDIEAEVERSETFLDSKRMILTRAKESIVFESESVTSDNNVVNHDGDSSLPRFPRHANLPKLHLPKFSGDHTKFQSFWDKFIAVVHNTDLPVISKFTYLLSLLSGEAHGALEGLSLTESNYDIARDILLKRYGRTERIVFCHIQQLMSLSYINDTTSNLWALYDKLQTHVRSLESLGITGLTYGVILTPLVLHRLPESVRMEWARQGEGKEADLEGLIKFLFEEIMNRERSLTFSQGGIPKEERRGKTRLQGSASALLASGGEEQERAPPKNYSVVCVLCKGGHPISKCYKFKNLTLADRYEKCRDMNLCYQCLRGNHTRRTCSSPTCTSCTGSHHYLLCEQ